MGRIYCYQVWVVEGSSFPEYPSLVVCQNSDSADCLEQELRDKNLQYRKVVVVNELAKR